MKWKWRDFSDHWEDWLSMAIGAWLVVSPSALGFANEEPAAANAIIVGSSITLMALLALIQFDIWEEWLVGVLGLWAIGAPWVLGFADHPNALWVHLTAGGLVAGLAAVELWVEHMAHVHEVGTKHPA